MEVAVVKIRGISRILASKNISLLFVLLVVVALFRILNPYYLAGDNIGSILNTMSLAGMLAVGLGCLIISGQLDLSVGGVGCLGGVIAALMIQAGMSWPLAVFVALLFGVVAGLITSVFCNIFNFAAFIATIAMQTVYRGIALVLTNSQTVPVSDQAFWAIGDSLVFGVPVSFIIMSALFIIYGAILMYSRFGRRAYICGGNPNAARLAGINPKKIHSVMFINCAVISSLGGVVLTARMHGATPSNVFGTEFDAITGAVLGGIAFTGGKGGMLGCFLGVLLLSCFNNGMVGIGLQPFWSLVARGSLLIIALSVDYLRESTRLKALKTAKLRNA